MRLFSFSTELNKSLSKNKRYIGRYNKIISKEHKEARAEAAHACGVGMVSHCCESIPQKTKLYITMDVYKPDNRMDALNFIDDFIDAIEPVIGVNDRYYALTLDWYIDKERPRIECSVHDSKPAS